MLSSPVRLLALALAAAIVIATGGAAWELVRFGSNQDTASQHLQAEVRARLDHSAGQLRAAAAQVAANATLIDAATADRDRIAELFAALPASPDAALTVYVPTGTGTFRVLAWNDGPAEDLEVPASVLEAPGLFVAQGTLGLRLVAWHPVLVDSRRVGVVAAEQVLSTTGGLHPSLAEYHLQTSFGPVQVVPSNVDPPAAADTIKPTVLSAKNTALLDIIFAPAELDDARREFRRRVLLAGILPLVGALLILAAGLVQSPRRSLQLGAPLLVIVAGGLFVWIGSMAGLPLVGVTAIGALTAVGLTLTLPVASWWRSAARRQMSGGSSLVMWSEFLGGGLLTAAVLWLTFWALDRQLTAVGYDRLASPLFPPNGAVLAAHAARHLLAFASVWAVATMLAQSAERWRVSWRRPLVAVLASGAWVVPTAIGALPNPWSPLPTPALIGVAAVAALFALSGVGLRHFYRHASPSSRLLALCAAAVIPATIWYPIVAFSANRSTERQIESVYAPTTMGLPEQLRSELERATEAVDRLPDLSALLVQPSGEPRSPSSDAAFLVWSQTGLSRSRLTSALELYGPDGQLVSRFALNVPDYGIDRSSTEIRCKWDTYGEVTSFGAREQATLHAERSLCDATGRSSGSVVIHVLFDYRALPFISAINPYDDLLRRASQSPQTGPHGVQTVVYGWGRQATFTSGRTAWSLDQGLLSQIERSRTPFWIARATDTDTFRVFFANDRAGIYAFGYPIPRVFDHLTKLAESTVLAALLFVGLFVISTFVASIAGRRVAPLRALIFEFRTSFYRKLFLYFVFTAVVPVLVFAFSFSAYMSDKLRGDVETEALTAATIARRVLEDTIALQEVPPTDDILVWIGQVINQDVNLFDGPRLRATSQRDLFESGLLPERTPASAYRAVALERRPSFAGEDRAGSFSYLVAAAPVPALGRHAVLSVPLALRQQEIEREITDLNRGVLLGAVLVILLAAFIGASVARRVSDPVERLTRATQQIAAGEFNVRIVADTADELRRLVNDFNGMAATLREQRAELGRAHELKAWADMSRQVAHDIKNPLTPIQLAAEHLQRVHVDQGRPLGAVFDQCVGTVLKQVKLLRQLANDFSSFAAVPVPKLERVPLAALLHEVVEPYLAGLASHTEISIDVTPDAPDARADRTLLARALTNLIENALQAMPSGGRVTLSAAPDEADRVRVTCADNGIGMTSDAAGRAFEPHFSTKTGGSGLGLANARQNIASCGGTITLESAPGQGTTVTVRLPVAGPDDARGGA